MMEYDFFYPFFISNSKICGKLKISKGTIMASSVYKIYFYEYTYGINLTFIAIKEQKKNQQIWFLFSKVVFHYFIFSIE